MLGSGYEFEELGILASEQVVASVALLGGALLPAVGAVVGVGLVGALVASFILKRNSGLDVKMYEIPVRHPAVPNAPRNPDAQVRSSP